MVDFNAIGQRIRQQRNQHGYTQERLAEILGISVEHLSRIETGAQRPSLTLIERLCSVFQIEESALMFGFADEQRTNSMLMERFDSLSQAKKEALFKIIDLIE